MNLRIELVRKVVAWQLSSWHKGTIAEQRARQGKGKRFDRVPSGVNCRPVAANGVPAEWIEAPSAGSGVMLYLHGGAYALGSIDLHRAFVARLAKACRMRGLAIDYRLAPEHPYPAALYDTIAAYQWLLEQGVDPQMIIFAGDSSGGGLAIAAQLALRDAGQPLPAAAVCISPWTDLTLSGASVQSKAAIDPLFDSDTLGMYAGWYAGDYETAYPPISPQFADMTGLPPLLIQVGSEEVLLDDSRGLAANAQKAGVDVTLEIWDGLFHVFPMISFLREGREAIGHIAEFASRTLDS